METIEATFRVVTPMFLSGADQDKAELRLPSLKGALRFWWRALAWGKHGAKFTDLRTAEAALFGGVEKGEGKAKILLKLANQEIRTAKQNRWSQNRWEAYVGYGLTETTEGTSRDYIEPGSSFTLYIISRKQLSADQQQDLRRTIVAFGLLGGLGGRSRNGWGSLNLTKIRTDYDQLAWEPPQQINDLKRQVQSLFTTEDEDLPVYTALSSQAKVEFGPLQRNAADAHRYLAQLYKETIKSIPGKAQREQFGLPRKNDNRRRASPLFLHMHELSDGQGVPMAIFLPAKFLGEGEVPDGGWRQVERYLQSVASGEVQ